MKVGPEKSLILLVVSKKLIAKMNLNSVNP